MRGQTTDPAPYGRLQAFNPFIPHNDRDSGLPGAFLCYEVTNRSGRPLAVTLAATLGNPLPGPQLHEHSTGTPLKWLHLATRGVPADDPAWGELTLMTDAGRVSVQDYGFRGRWFDDLEIMMRDLGTPGPLRQRTYPSTKWQETTAPCRISISPTPANASAS